MDYEKLYNEAILRAQKHLLCANHGVDGIIEDIFPELAQSKDEKMFDMCMKALDAPDARSCIKSWGINPDDVKNWLEKQKEQRKTGIPETIYPRFCVGDVLCRKGWDDCTVQEIYLYYDPVYICKNTEGIETHISFSEQDKWWKKPIEPDTETRDIWEYTREWTDKFGRFPKDEDELVACIDYVMKRQKPANKIEPKFKVGDWIINNDKRIAVPTQILEIEEYGYVTSRGYTSFDKVKTDYHLWNIQDAKDGDVLVSKIDEEPNGFIYIFKEHNQNLGFWSHCYLDAYINKFHEGIYHNSYNEGVPATKEQCDLLFQKMKEAGYEWDAEKKELKKIEQKPIEWIEDDLIDRILSDKRVQYASIDDGIKSHAKTYSFNIESQLFPQLNEEQQKLWRKEIEQAVISGGDTGVNLANDERYKENNMKWSEEDVKHFEGCLQYFSTITKNSIFYEDYLWLKSIKPRWKPSEEQMESLMDSIQSLYACKEKNLLLDLYEQLQKL